MRRMSSTESSVWPKHRRGTGLQALCDIGATQLAMLTSGDASHSPQPTYAARLHPHQQQVLAAVADVENRRHRQVVEVHRIDLHARVAPVLTRGGLLSRA